MPGYRIAFVAAEERRAAAEFHEGFILKRYGCKPPPLPQMVVAAWKAGSIVGLIGCDFSDRLSGLPVTSLYLIEPAEIPRAADLAEIGRWSTEDPRLSIELAHAVVERSLKEGRHFGVCALKPEMNRYLVRLGIKTSLLSDRLDESRILALCEEERKYYVEPPLPKLYLLDLSQTREALAARIRAA